MNYFTGNVDARKNEQLEKMMVIKNNRVFKKSVGAISDYLNKRNEAIAVNTVNEGAKTKAIKDVNKAIRVLTIGGIVVIGGYFLFGFGR